ncbi:hypothetical protein GIB67_016998 [Kingdonia uniflora]|uniref:Uncharacterized protein n=1 Tax=Kingdonia uniflora TaxID=39325 RepID=A0A7J7M3R4_9MAGN|nr:hypothetical protein GIB67_016998 [Kingdonia uniflora]
MENERERDEGGDCKIEGIHWAFTSVDGEDEKKDAEEVGGYMSNEEDEIGLVLLDLVYVSPLVPEVPKENVHSGALPRWLETIDDFQPNIHANSSKKSGKSQKLNPNWVGAAWAEKRKTELEMEMEMEKREEIVANNCDADWLPNFG